MNRRKLHISPALQLGIAVLLLLCCMTVAVGVTFARYHKGEKGSLIFEPEQNLQVCLGYIENDSFVCSQNEWMRFEEQLQLAFAISNGSSNHEFAPTDQMVCLRVVASLGVFNEEMAECVKIVDGRAMVEASGNMGDKDLCAVAKTGVDIISIGALTHSVKAADISLKFTIS